MTPHQLARGFIASQTYAVPSVESVARLIAEAMEYERQACVKIAKSFQCEGDGCCGAGSRRACVPCRIEAAILARSAEPSEAA